jgi:cysteine desulfurase/selenocysteine lyase
MGEVEEHEKMLTKRLLEVLQDLEVVVYGPLDLRDRLGVVSFNIPGLTPHEVASMLDLEGIAVRSGHHCALPLVKRLGTPMGTTRASLYLYNTCRGGRVLRRGPGEGEEALPGLAPYASSWT